MTRSDGTSTALDGIGATLIFGSSRSGTSWLAKIFDSHPDVLYRHEPDIVYRPDCLPRHCPATELAAYHRLACNYLERLAKVRTVKAAGSPPVFAKHGRSELARLLRVALILGIRGSEAVIGNRQWLARIPIPDLIARRQRHNSRLVIKSVSSYGYARLFAEAWPAARIIVILRHPCGHVASVIRGVELGKMAAPEPLGAIGRSPEARRLGLEIDGSSELAVASRLAWEWAFLNQRMLDDLSGLDRVRIIKYEELAARPADVARDLFAFAGLSWSVQTEKFIAKSTAPTRSDRYYAVIRDPLRAANRWRTSLSAEDQNRVLAIAQRVPVGRLFIEKPPRMIRPAKGDR